MSVLVTGASRGIGRAICARLIGEADLVGVYRSNHAAAESLASELGAAPAGHTLRTLACDLTNAPARAELIDGLRASQVRFRGVVMNAGVAHYSPFVGSSGQPSDPVLAELRGNLEAPLLFLRGLLEADLVESGASVVFVSSNLVRHALAGHVGYAAAKAGLEAAVKQLCAELGPRRIRVNAVAPGLILTDMTGHMSDSELATYASEVPLGRSGSPDDIARCVAFFLGEQSEYVSGQVLDVDGGWGCR